VIKEVQRDLADKITPLAADLSGPWLKVLNKSNLREQLEEEQQAEVKIEKRKLQLITPGPKTESVRPSPLDLSSLFPSQVSK